MGSNRWVHLIFAVGGVLLTVVSIMAVEWIWSYFDKPRDLIVSVIGILIGGGAAFMMWRNQNLFTKATEVTMELKKVTWPTRKEPQAATVVVIVTVIIASMFLGIFDLIWSWATGLIYA